MLKTKNDIVRNWLPRYTGMPLEEFGQYILLNLAIGSCGGEVDDTAFPMIYEVDYVRVYQTS